ncbi:hypothetical protein AD998_13690 [bacterium 336/3]|nr:hypothetical protein AD998_13690 [bacterium 336/3]
MKTLTCTLSFFLLIAQFSAFGQNIDKVKGILANKSFTKLDTYLINFCAKNPNAQYSQEINRQIISSYYEIIVFFKESVPTEIERISKVYPYKIYMLVKDDKIIYFKIENHQKPKNIKIEEIFSNKATIQTFEKAYLLTYNRKVTINDFFKTNIVYGYSCGYAGTKTEYGIKQSKLIELKNTEELEQWLASPIPEIQVYAVAGFYKLKQQGYQPTPKQLSLIKLIKSKKGTINTCHGCIYMREEIQFATQDFEF